MMVIDEGSLGWRLVKLSVSVTDGATARPAGLPLTLVQTRSTGEAGRVPAAPCLKVLLVAGWVVLVSYLSVTAMIVLPLPQQVQHKAPTLVSNL